MTTSVSVSFLFQFATQHAALGIVLHDGTNTDCKGMETVYFHRSRAGYNVRDKCYENIPMCFNGVLNNCSGMMGSSREFINNTGILIYYIQ